VSTALGHVVPSTEWGGAHELLRGAARDDIVRSFLCEEFDFGAPARNDEIRQPVGKEAQMEVSVSDRVERPGCPDSDIESE
jgi:hypothetical protein